MGRAKVVYKKVTNGRPAESKETAVAASSASSPAPALPKKRGRPRKIPKEEVPAPVVEDKKPEALISNDISQLSVSDSGKKRSRTGTRNGNSHGDGDNSSAEVVKTTHDGESGGLDDEPVIKPTVITRRQGSRRKSEPRRAAGAFMDSN